MQYYISVYILLFIISFAARDNLLKYQAVVENSQILCPPEGDEFIMLVAKLMCDLNSKRGWRKCADGSDKGGKAPSKQVSGKAPSNNSLGGDEAVEKETPERAAWLKFIRNMVNTLQVLAAQSLIMFAVLIDSLLYR